MIKSIRQILPKLLRPEYSFPFIVLAGLLLYYFYPLFYPPQLFYTADYGLSDIWHFHYPVKHLLATALKAGHLPFWTPLIGSGLPVFAEGQIGALYPPNLILFALLPTWLAWNLSFPLALAIAFTGTYLFLRLLERSIFASTFAAFIFSFSSFFVLHFVHLTLIQSACLLPFAFWGYHRFYYQQSLKNLLFAAIPLALQIYAGYFQIFVITCIALGIYFFTLFLISRKNLLFLSILLLPGILALLLSAPQLLPTIELSRLSSFRDGSPQALRFPLHLKSLITFIFPDYFGTPALGTIPANYLLGECQLLGSYPSRPILIRSRQTSLSPTPAYYFPSNSHSAFRPRPNHTFWSVLQVTCTQYFSGFCQIFICLGICSRYSFRLHPGLSYPSFLQPY